MKPRKIIALLTMLILTAGLLAGCGEKSQNLTINTNKTIGGTFSLIDSSSKNQIIYNKLLIDGDEVYETYVNQASIGTAWVVNFAFEEGQIIVNGNSVTLSGSIGLTDAGEWKYTLDNGVLNIITE